MPWISGWDGVYFLWISQPACHQIPIFCNYCRMNSLPPLCPLQKECRAFWLSTHRCIGVCLVPLPRRAHSPSWIACISLSSMSPLFPMQHFPSQRVAWRELLVTQECRALATVASSFFQPSMYRSSVPKWSPSLPRLCATLSVANLSEDMVGSAKVGRS